MGTPEVPLEHAHETIEHHAHGTTEPWVMGVALTAAILAALAAVTALYAEHFANEAMLEQIHASDRWSEFQANSIKEKVTEAKKELLTNLKNEPDPLDEAQAGGIQKEEGRNQGKSRRIRGGVEHALSQTCAALAGPDYVSNRHRRGGYFRSDQATRVLVRIARIWSDWRRIPVLGIGNLSQCGSQTRQLAQAGQRPIAVRN